MTREIRRDQKENVALRNVDYRYGPNTVGIVGRENGTSWRITRKLDARGNTIESSSSGISYESRAELRSPPELV